MQRQSEHLLVENLRLFLYRVLLKLLVYLIRVCVLAFLHGLVVLAHRVLQLVRSGLTIHVAEYYRNVLYYVKTDELRRPDDHGLPCASASEQLRRHRDRHAAGYLEGQRSPLRIEIHQRGQFCKDIQRSRSDRLEITLTQLVVRLLARRLRRVVSDRVLITLKRRRLAELLTVPLHLLL